jgi:hypothetical protein
MFLLQKFHGKKKFFNPWEGVKVGSCETFLTATPC